MKFKRYNYTLLYKIIIIMVYQNKIENLFEYNNTAKSIDVKKITINS